MKEYNDKKIQFGNLVSKGRWEIQEEMRKYEEDRRQINRQKAMLAPGALVLFPDFLKRRLPRR